MNVKKVIIYTDGAARGNPGPAAIGAIIEDEWGNIITSISRRIGIATNNQAEYQAVIDALETATSLGAQRVELRSDSELVVKQLKGEYRLKNKTLLPLYQRVKRLSGSLESFSLVHVPREQNAEADRLTNKALDTK